MTRPSGCKVNWLVMSDECGCGGAHFLRMANTNFSNINRHKFPAVTGGYPMPMSINFEESHARDSCRIYYAQRRRRLQPKCINQAETEIVVWLVGAERSTLTIVFSFGLQLGWCECALFICLQLCAQLIDSIERRTALCERSTKATTETNGIQISLFSTFRKNQFLVFTVCFANQYSDNHRFIRNHNEWKNSTWSAFRLSIANKQRWRANVLTSFRHWRLCSAVEQNHLFYCIFVDNLQQCSLWTCYGS